MKRQSIYAFVLSFTVFASCSKSDLNTSELETDVLTAEEDMFSDADNTYLDEASLQEFPSDEFSGGRYAEATDSSFTPPCATRTWEIIDSLHRILTIDFGDEPCLCRDSIFRKGKVIIHFEGRRGFIGFKRVITFERYVVNGRKMDGFITIIYKGDLTWERTLERGIIVFPDSTKAFRQSRQLIVQLEGMDVPGPEGDVFKVTGSASGVNRKGIKYVSNIREPLVRRIERGCARVFVKGIVVTRNENEDEVVLNYDPRGTAACDRVASVTINGVTRLIRLR